MPDLPRDTPPDDDVVLAWWGISVGFAFYGTVCQFGTARTGWWRDGMSAQAPDWWVPLPLARRAREMEVENKRMREALEWYARPHRVDSPAKEDCAECGGTGSMWDESPHNGSRYRTQCDCIKNTNAHVGVEYQWDKGKRARAALEDTDGR